MEGNRVSVVGIARMAALYKAGSDESMYVFFGQEMLWTDIDLVDGFGDVVWGIIENGLAIICACLPTYRPLLTKGFSLTTDFHAWYSSLLHNTRSWRGGSQSSKTTPSTDANKGVFENRKRYNQIEDGMLDGTYLTSVTGDFEASADTVAGKDFPLDSIRVKNTTEVV